MLFSQTTFIGIDPTAGQRPLTYVALEDDLRLLALSHGDLNEVLAFVAGQRQALVAVCAPSRPNQGLMDREEVRQSLSPPPRPGRWMNFRLVEYQLRQHNITCPQTASDESACPAWMQVGFSIYRRLESLGYRPYPQEGALQWLEVYPHACFVAMLGLTPFPKHTFEGRIQRQLVLFEQGIRLPDPMRLFEEITRHRLLQGILPLNELYPPAELDAIVGAYTSWMAATHPEKITALGNSNEGQVFLPVAELKKRYMSA